MTTQSQSASGEPSDGAAGEPEPVLRLEEPVQDQGISADLEKTLLSMGVSAATVRSAKTHTLPSLTTKERISSRLRHALAAVAKY